jgi:DNA adenine methylase
MTRPVKFPAPYFGGKSAVAKDVWGALGQPKHYIEPFLGSGAVLLARPNYQPDVHIETVNDSDGFLCNVWRALQFSPDETARWCDWPVNHADLMARKAALIKNEGRLLEGLAGDDKWHDPVMAGYWIWAASCWIGRGLTRPGSIPHVSDSGSGVHALGQIPNVSRGGNGVHSLGKRPDVSCEGRGVREPYNTNLFTWFRQLSERLRYVRVVCGDWTRVCGGNWQDNMGIVGMFFDPPYSADTGRDMDIYHQDSHHVAKDVNAWCLARGAKPLYRIVLAGYYEEHENLLQHGWKVTRWKAHGGYSHLGNGKRKANRHREALFISPHCCGGQALLWGG